MVQRMDRGIQTVVDRRDIDNTEADRTQPRKARPMIKSRKSGAADKGKMIVIATVTERRKRRGIGARPDMLRRDDAEDAVPPKRLLVVPQRKLGWRMFQKIRNISGTSGQFVAQVQSESSSTATRDARNEQGADVVVVRLPQTPRHKTVDSSVILPDHSIHVCDSNCRSHWLKH
jgi:hypothetical protein